MCTGQPPATVAEALAALRARLAFLNQVPAADLPGVVQADCLRELAKAESAYTAAHARMLGAFAASGAHEDDGQQSERAVAEVADPDHQGRGGRGGRLDETPGRPPGGLTPR